MAISFGVQLYSVRDEVKSQGLASVIARVAKMGYAAVEFAGYFDHSATEVRKMLDDAGVVACGTHVRLETLEGDELARSIEFHKTIGCEYLIVPWIDGKLRDAPEACRATAERFSKVSAALRPHGMKTGFHLHDIDIKPVPNGKSPWYQLAEQTPDDFILQFDTGNAMAGGADPVKPLLDFPGRGLSVHLKEFPVDGTATGLGSVPWQAVLDATKRVAGTKWHVIEIENYSKYTPMEAVAASYGAMAALTRAM